MKLPNLFRIEKIDLRVKGNQAKVIGTLVLITGALILTLYKGPQITFAASPKLLHPGMVSDWIIGGILLAAHSAILSLYLVLLVNLVTQIL